MFLFVCFGCEVSSFEYFFVIEFEKLQIIAFEEQAHSVGARVITCDTCHACLHWPFRFKELWRLWHHWLLMWYLLHYGFSLCCTVGCTLCKPIITYIIMLLSCRILLFVSKLQIRANNKCIGRVNDLIKHEHEVFRTCSRDWLIMYWCIMSLSSIFCIMFIKNIACNIWSRFSCPT